MLGALGLEESGALLVVVGLGALLTWLLAGPRGTAAAVRARKRG